MGKRRGIGFIARVGALCAMAGALLATGLSPLGILGSTPAGATANPHLVFSTTPGAATAGAAFGTQPKVTYEKSTGAVTTAATAAITLSASGPSSSITGCAAGTPSAGVVTFSGCEIDTSGSGYKLTASASNFTAGTSGSFNVSPGKATKVVFAQEPGNITAGGAFSPAVKLTVEDAKNNAATTAGITLDLLAFDVTGAGQGPLVCTGGEISPSSGPHAGAHVYQLIPSGGSATFTGCTVDQASSTNYKLVAVATRGGTLTALTATSTGFSVSAGSASKLVFTSNPSNALLNQAFGVQPVVKVEDAAGNVVSTTGTVTLSVTASTGTPGAALHGCSTGTLSNGVATFTGCSLDKTGTAYKLNASLSSPSLSGKSGTFTVSAGAASVLTFKTEPGNGFGGSPLSAQPVVTLADSTGDPVSGAVTLSLEESTGAVLTCTPNPAPAGTGTATFKNCAVNKAGTYHLVASDPQATGVTPVTSTSFRVTTGPAAQVVFTRSPSTPSSGGTPFSTQPKVLVEDLGGNLVPNSTVTLKIMQGTGNPGAHLSCTAPNNKITAVSGTATFSGCSVDLVGTGYQLTATSGSVVGHSTAFNVTTGPASKLTFSAQPSGGTASTPLGGQPQVSVTDAGGNPVADGGVPVHLTISSGTLTCIPGTDSATTNAAGTAIFVGCKTTAGSSLTLGVTTTTYGLSGTTSAAFTVVAGTALATSPTTIAVPQTFGTATVGTNPTNLTDDVNSATGALDTAFTDIKVAAVGEPFTLTRTYNSNDTTGGAFGPGWSSILDAGVTVAPNGKSAVVRGIDGQQLTFTATTAGGPWTAPPGAKASLACTGALCTVTYFSGTVFHSVGGQIQDYVSADGIGLSFIYTNGHLSRITGSAKSLVSSVQTVVAAQLGTQAWKTVTAGSANLDAVAAVSTTALWAAGANCTLEYSANGGATWTVDTHVTGCPSGATLTGLALNGAGPDFAVGSQGTVLECASACSAATAVWVRPVGTSLPPATVNLSSVWSPSSTKVYAVGTTTSGAGEIWTCNTNCAKTTVSQTWANISPTGLSSTALTSVSGQGSSYTAVVGAGGTVLLCAVASCKTTASGWGRLKAGSGGVVPASTVQFSGVSVAGANRLYAVGTANGGSTGVVWACNADCSATTTGPAGTAKVAVWTNVTPSGLGGTALTAVRGQATTSVWSVGSNGQVWYCAATCGNDPTAWVTVGTPGGPTHGLAAVTSTDANHAWAVGAAGTVDDTAATTSALLALESAAAAIGTALTPTGWVDGNHPSPTLGTAQVLTQLVNAVKALSQAALASLPGWDAAADLSLEQALHIISANALSENIVNPAKPTSLATAQKQYTTATSEMAGGQFPTAAAGFQTVWTDALAAAGTGQGSHTPLQVKVTENATGQVTGITTPTRALHYTYTGGLLTRFTDDDGGSWTYTYGGSPAVLTRVVDPTGVTRLTVAYSGGRVSAASSLGSSTHFVDTYSWNSGTGVSTRSASVQLSPGAPITTALSYDEYAGNVLLAQQLPSGATTSYSYDANLDLTGVQDPLGRVERMTYNTTGDLLTQTSPGDTGNSVVTFTYNTKHQYLSETDPNSNTTKYAYTAANLVLITPPGPAATGVHYRYNYLGEQYETDGPTGVLKFTFDGAGNQTGYQLMAPNTVTSINGLGPVFSFNESGQQTVGTDPRGHTSGGLNHAYQTVQAFDNNGELLSTTAPGGQTTSTSYRPDGAIASTTQPTGHQTTYSWNEATLQQTATGPAGATISTYDPSGQLLSQTPAGGSGNAATTYTYDTSGHQLSKTGPTGVTTFYRYNLEGSLVATSTTTGSSATYGYDVANRIVTSTVNGVSTSTTYDLDGNVASQTDADGRTTTFTYNSHELLSSVKTAAGTTTYGYDAANNLTSVTDGNGNTIKYQVNPAGKRTSMTVAGHLTTYGYDVAGNLVTSKDPDGRTTTYTLNPQNERTEIVHSQSGHPTISIAQTFTTAGQLASVTDTTTGLTSYTYDTAGELTSATTGSDTYRYNYSTPGQMNETYPDGTNVSYAYDDSHRLMGVTAPGVHVAYLRNASRQVTAIAYSNGVLQTQSYNAAGQVTATALTCGMTTELVRASTLDASGAPLATATTVESTTTTQRWGYDGSARLKAQLSSTTSALHPLGNAGCTTGTQSTTPPGNDTSGTTTTIPPPVTQAPQSPSVPTEGSPGTGTSSNPITFDAVGDITSIHGITISYNSADEVSSSSGTNHATYTYDNNGDVLTKTVGGVTTTYTYNAADQLATVTKGGNTFVAYTYDGVGNRASRTVTDTNGTSVSDYSWDPSVTIKALALICHGDCATRSNVDERFIYGAGPVALQTQTATYYLHEDQQGDIIAVSNDKGQLVKTYSYDAFGNVTTTNVDTLTAPANPLLFQGQYLDRYTGLYDMRARNYDPSVGTFTQRDPVQPTIGEPVFSPYSYANDQATVSADPNGDAAGSAVVDAVYYAHSTQTANIVGVTRDAVAVTLFSLKSYKLISEYGSKVEASAASEIEDTASAVRGLGPEFAADADGISADLGGAAEAGTDLAKGAGRVLGVAALGLGVYLTVKDCEDGTVAQCVGDSIGLALGVACTALTEGAGALLCGMAAAAIGIVIAKYGPEIVQGLAQLGEWEIEGITDAVNAITKGFHELGDALAGPLSMAYSVAKGAIVSAFNTVAGVLTTGFNKLVGALSSGFDKVMSTLEHAGDAANDLGGVLKDLFNDTPAAALNELINLGYDVDALASALLTDFGLTATTCATILHGLEYTWTQVASGLKTAYNVLATVAATILQGIGAGIDDIGNFLDSVYKLAGTVGATILKGLGYAADAIAGALKDAWDAIATTVAGWLHSIGITPTAIAHALSGAFSALLSGTIAGILTALGITLSSIGTALLAGLGITGAAITRIFKTTLGKLATEVGTALKNAFGDVWNTITGWLTTVDFTISTIEHVLTAFGLTTTAIENALKNFWTTTVIAGLGGVFSSIGSFFTTTVASWGTTIASWF